MNKCIDCKYWNRFTMNNEVPEMANCKKLSMCDPTEGVAVDPSDLGEDVILLGMEDYDTGKDFGCVHWKAKSN